MRRGIGWAAVVCVLALGGRARAQEEEPPPPRRARAPEHASDAPDEPALIVQVSGLMAMSLYYDTAPMRSADAPFIAMGGDGASLGATARHSRLGLDVGIPAVAEALGAEEAATIAEIDFVGGYYPVLDLTWAMSIPRLRLFYAYFAWESGALAIGQDWMSFAPVNPRSVVHVGIAGFQQAGNMWNRLPQIRGELYLGPLVIEAAVLSPVSAGEVRAAGADAPSVIRDAGPADRALMPSLQARAAVFVDLAEDEAEIGISAHYGREQVDLDRSDVTTNYVIVDSWGTALDLELPIGPYFSLRGEVVLGANLDGLFSIADVTDAGLAAEVFGGWAQLSFRYGALAVHVGAGSEHVGLLSGMTLTRGPRQNSAFIATLAAHVGPLVVGLETTYIETRRFDAPKATGAQLGLGVLLPF